MMRPTDILREEHRSIEVMLSVLERICLKLEANERIDSSHLEQAIDFLKGYADACHHMKEENLLFPAMVKNGFSREDGPIGVMLEEHILGRQCIAAMTEALAAMKRESPGASAAFVRAARQYTSLLSEHIAKEDNILFPMAEHHLDGDVRSVLITEFERISHEEIGEARQETYRRQLTTLKGIYLL